MRLNGIYTGGNVNVPDGIRAMGSDDEFKRVGTLPVVKPDMTFPGGKSVVIAPDKAAVRQIAKATEIDCQDQRLIDWMAQG